MNNEHAELSHHSVSNEWSLQNHLLSITPLTQRTLSQETLKTTMQSLPQADMYIYMCVYIHMYKYMYVYIYIYIYLHLNSLQSAMWPQALIHIHFILLSYASEQICPPHCTYMSHYITTIIYIWTQHYCTYHSKKKNKKLHIGTTLLLPYMCQQEICHIYKLAHLRIRDNYVSIYIPYKPTAINNVK